VGKQLPLPLAGEEGWAHVSMWGEGVRRCMGRWGPLFVSSFLVTVEFAAAGAVE